LKFNPNKIRVEILLPLSYNDGKPIEKSKFVNTERELAQHFGGCTTLIPVEGLKEYADINSGFYVVAPLNKESKSFFEAYVKKLKKRFKQKHILLTFLPIRRILF
jgi:hypothetical protein